MIDYALNFQFNSTLGLLLYWLPLTFCAFGYLLRTHRNYCKDKLARETPGAYYSPTDRLGTLIGRGMVSVIPIGNLLAAVFDLAPEVFARLFERLEKLFDIPLVPDTENAKAKRDAGRKKP
jgi:hypothetical protein